MRRPARIAVNALFLFALIAGFLYSNAKVKNYRDNLPFKHVKAEALMLDPTFLKIISGEFKGLVADYLNLKAAIIKGGAEEMEDEDWQALYTLFKQSIELDPLFFHTGYYTQGILAWREGWHEKAVEILIINAGHRYWDWEPKFYLGFDYFYYLKDDEMGASYLKASSQLPGAPTLTTTLAARLMQRSGHTLTAIAFLKSMLERAKDESIIQNLTQRLKAHLGVYQLEQALESFKNKNGRLPVSLDALVAGGYIGQIPDNPMGDGFYYNPGTGEISFETRRQTIN